MSPISNYLDAAMSPLVNGPVFQKPKMTQKKQKYYKNEIVPPNLIQIVTTSPKEKDITTEKVTLKIILYVT
jgi:hypothetical protein